MISSGLKMIKKLQCNRCITEGPHLSCCDISAENEDRICHLQVEVSRQNLFALTYIGRVVWSEVSAPAPLSSPRHGIISILCYRSGELFWCPRSRWNHTEGPAHFPALKVAVSIHRSSSSSSSASLSLVWKLDQQEIGASGSALPHLTASLWESSPRQ